MGLKFLRNGIDSANLVSMYAIDGQPNDWNFFSNSFFNHIGAPDPVPTDIEMVNKKFSSATDFT